MRRLGYQFLIHEYQLTVPEPYRKSFLSDQNRIDREQFPESEEVYYPARYQSVQQNWQEQILFALKNEGINLSVLSAFFSVISIPELTEWILEEPTSKYRRKIWFLYEWLTGRELSLPSVSNGNYIPILDPERYFTLKKGQRSQRHRIVNNLPGTPALCPMIYRTKKIKEFQTYQLTAKIEKIQSQFDPELIADATSYLSIKETKSSFALERLNPDRKKTARLIEILKTSSRSNLTKKYLLTLQHSFVEKRFQDQDYRAIQVYVGESISPIDERVHYIAPKPEDIHELMSGWLEMIQRLIRDPSDPVLVAVVVSFTFVFLHPFNDGNGRLHRFLLNDILSRLCLIPKGIVLPFSAQFYKKPAEYDQMLESFSRKIDPIIDYQMDNRGQLAVTGKTAHYYRYPDMTTIAEHFYQALIDTIDFDFLGELKYLQAFRQAKREMKEVVDLPDDLMRRLIYRVQPNHGKLSRHHRREFEILTDEEIEQLSEIIKNRLCSDSNEFDPIR